MERSANSSSSKTTGTDDFFDITKFPEIDTAFVTSIWKEEQKMKQGSNSREFARLIRSIDADISTPNEGFDSFTYSEASSSLSVPAEQADDNPISSSIGGIELCVDFTSYSMKDLRIHREKAVEVKREGDRNGSKQKLKKSHQRKKWI